MNDVQREDIVIKASDLRMIMVELDNEIIHLAASQNSDNSIDSDVAELATQALAIVVQLENLVRSKVGW